MRKKKGFSLEQHDQSGLELQTMFDRLVEIVVDISNHYPRRSKVDRLAEKAYATIFELRSELDNLACKEHGHRTDMNPGECYFRATRVDHIKDPQPIRPFPKVH